MFAAQRRAAAPPSLSSRMLWGLCTAGGGGGGGGGSTCSTAGATTTGSSNNATLADFLVRGDQRENPRTQMTRTLHGRNPLDKRFLPSFARSQAVVDLNAYRNILDSVMTPSSTSPPKEEVASSQNGKGGGLSSTAATFSPPVSVDIRVDAKRALLGSVFRHFRDVDQSEAVEAQGRQAVALISAEDIVEIGANAAAAKMEKLEKTISEELAEQQRLVASGADETIVDSSGGVMDDGGMAERYSSHRRRRAAAMLDVTKKRMDEKRDVTKLEVEHDNPDVVEFAALYLNACQMFGCCPNDIDPGVMDTIRTYVLPRIGPSCSVTAFEALLAGMCAFASPSVYRPRTKEASSPDAVDDSDSDVAVDLLLWELIGVGRQRPRIVDEEATGGGGGSSSGAVAILSEKDSSGRQKKLWLTEAEARRMRAAGIAVPESSIRRRPRSTSFPENSSVHPGLRDPQGETWPTADIILGAFTSNPPSETTGATVASEQQPSEEGDSGNATKRQQQLDDDDEQEQVAAFHPRFSVTHNHACVDEQFINRILPQIGQNALTAICASLPGLFSRAEVAATGGATGELCRLTQAVLDAVCARCGSMAPHEHVVILRTLNELLQLCVSSTSNSCSKKKEQHMESVVLDFSASVEECARTILPRLARDLDQLLPVGLCMCVTSLITLTTRLNNCSKSSTSQQQGSDKGEACDEDGSSSSSELLSSAVSELTDVAVLRLCPLVDTLFPLGDGTSSPVAAVHRGGGTLQHAASVPTGLSAVVSLLEALASSTTAATPALGNEGEQDGELSKPRKDAQGSNGSGRRRAAAAAGNRYKRVQRELFGALCEPSTMNQLLRPLLLVSDYRQTSCSAIESSSSSSPATAQQSSSADAVAALVAAELSVGLLWACVRLRLGVVTPAASAAESNGGGSRATNSTVSKRVGAAGAPQVEVLDANGGALELYALLTDAVFCDRAVVGAIDDGAATGAGEALWARAQELRRVFGRDVAVSSSDPK